MTDLNRDSAADKIAANTKTVAARAAWIRPALTRISAGSAENGPSNVSDQVFTTS